MANADWRPVNTDRLALFGRRQFVTDTRLLFVILQQPSQQRAAAQVFAPAPGRGKFTAQLAVG
jgi:hypothetical protein